VSPSVSILSVLVARVSNKLISIPISLRELQKNNETVDLEALLYSGAGGLFIDETFARNLRPSNGERLDHYLHGRHVNPWRNNGRT
jgi:hypothetical protein